MKAGMRSAGSGYTIVQTAQLVSAMRWLTARLFEITGVWAADAAVAFGGSAAIPVGVGVGEAGADEVVDASAVAVWLAAVSRCLGSHLEVLDGLQPDSVFLDVYCAPTPPAAAIGDALDEVFSDHMGWARRVEIILDVFLPKLMEVCDGIERVAAPHCDGALIRAARKLRLDLSLDHTVGSRLSSSIRSDRMLHSRESDGALAHAVDVISENGLVSIAVLCPDNSDAVL